MVDEQVAAPVAEKKKRDRPSGFAVQKAKMEAQAAEIAELKAQIAQLGGAKADAPAAPTRTTYEQVQGEDGGGETPRSGMHTVKVAAADIRGADYGSPVQDYKDRGYVVMTPTAKDRVHGSQVLLGIPQEEYDRVELERVTAHNRDLGLDAKGKPLRKGVDMDARDLDVDDVVVGDYNTVKRKGRISPAQIAASLPSEGA